MKPFRAYIYTAIYSILGVVDRFRAFSTGVLGTKYAYKFSIFGHVLKILEPDARAFQVYPSITFITLYTILSFKAEFSTFYTFI